jgi:tRNA threonylcarbamoyladenosine biosynthesis protein TsaB
MQPSSDRHETGADAGLLVIETSHRRGAIALALGERVLGERRLDEARRHARDLAPAVRDLLMQEGWKPHELTAVLVSRGPGSYTGLRVGVMSAKTLAYATGCTLLALDTFAAIALQAPADAMTLDVIADAQQDKLYVQRFTRCVPGAALTSTPLAIEAFATWQATVPAGSCVIGPGLEKWAAHLPTGCGLAAKDAWFSSPASLLQLGLARLRRSESDDPFGVEPIYLRPSSAEENWKSRRDDRS